MEENEGVDWAEIRGFFYRMCQLCEPELSFSPWVNLKGHIPLYMVPKGKFSGYPHKVEKMQLDVGNEPYLLLQ